LKKKSSRDTAGQRRTLPRVRDLVAEEGFTLPEYLIDKKCFFDRSGDGFAENTPKIPPSDKSFQVSDQLSR
jgi:hypothetical protein